MDIAKKLALKAASNPKTEWAPLLIAASEYIESLEKEIAELRKMKTISENDTPNATE